MLLTFGESFRNLFSNIIAEWYVLILLVLGIVFCIIEGFVAGFGAFGILGMLMEIAGIITYSVLNKNALEIFILILMLVIIFLILFLLFVRSAKFGILSKTPIVENKSSISQNYAQNEKETLKTLIGKTGIAITDCHPIGSAKIDEIQYDVRAKNKLIHKGEKIVVVEIDDDRIVVDKN